MVSFGRLPKQSRVPDKGVFVFGRLAQLDLKEWLSLSGNVSEAGGDNATTSVYADVAVQNATLGDLTFDNLSLSCSSSESGHRIAIRSRQASGLIHVPRNDGAIKADLDYLTLPEQKDEAILSDSGEKLQSEDPLTDVDPSLIPKVDLSISQLQVGETNAGVWKARFTPLASGVEIAIFDSHVFEINTTANIVWTKVNERHTSFVDAQLKAKNLKDDILVFKL